MLPANTSARPGSPRASARLGMPGSESGLYLELIGSIRKIVLDRPSKKNAISRAMYAALEASLREAADTDATDVVLLASSGGAFSVGSDLEEFLASDQSFADSEAFALAAGSFLRTLASFPKPIVAAVGGLASGAGATILLHCDLVVAAQTAAFQFGFMSLSTLPEGGASVLLASRVGIQRASEWLLCGDRIDVETAFRFGLVNAVVHGGELERAAIARAEAITRLPQSAVRETKRLLRAPLREAIGEAISREIDATSVRLSSPPPSVAPSSLPPASALPGAPKSVRGR